MSMRCPKMFSNSRTKPAGNHVLVMGPFSIRWHGVPRATLWQGVCQGGRADARRGHQREQCGRGWEDAGGGKGRLIFLYPVPVRAIIFASSSASGSEARGTVSSPLERPTTSKDESPE